MVRKELDAVGFAGTYEEMLLPARFVSKLGVRFAANFDGVENAREATSFLRNLLKFSDGDRPKVSRTNKFVLQLAAPNMELVSKKATSQTAGSPSASSCSTASSTGTPSLSGRSSGSSVDGGSDTESSHADDADVFVPRQRRIRARSACRADEAGFCAFETIETRIVGEGWQHFARQHWTARLSVKGTFIDVAELKW